MPTFWSLIKKTGYTILEIVVKIRSVKVRADFLLTGIATCVYNQKWNIAFTKVVCGLISSYAHYAANLIEHFIANIIF